MEHRKILIMGLPGSGKTTLAKELVSLLNAVHFNGDEVRRNINIGLGFAEQDRVEQARRMGWLCDRVAETGAWAVADFICPTEETRSAFGQCFLVFMDTVSEGRYEDTNKIFEPPQKPNFRVTEKDARLHARLIRDELIGKKRYSMFIGRFQPLHDGHIKLIQTVLDEGKDVLVALRDTPLDEKNPYTARERADMFLKAFSHKVRVIVIPDISEVCYGRDVGWGVREIRLHEDIERISATEIRRKGGSGRQS